MSNLIVTRGLPASGKTTRARAAVAAAPVGSIVRLNRDDYRTMMFGGWTGNSKHEDLVTIAQVEPARTLLWAGVDVICDDTNLPEAAMDRWRDLAAETGAELVVWDLRGVPLYDCLMRNNVRLNTPAFVPPEEIRRMWADHIKPNRERIQYP